MTAATPIEKNRPAWMEKTRIELDNAQRIKSAFNMQQLKNIPIAGNREKTDKIIYGNKNRVYRPKWKCEHTSLSWHMHGGVVEIA